MLTTTAKDCSIIQDQFQAKLPTRYLSLNAERSIVVVASSSHDADNFKALHSYACSNTHPTFHSYAGRIGFKGNSFYCRQHFHFMKNRTTGRKNHTTGRKNHEHKLPPAQFLRKGRKYAEFTWLIPFTDDETYLLT